MGKYINIGNAEFESVRKDEYVDKSMLIAYVNKVLGTQRKFLCVTRARRFGKSIAAKMLNAYYDESVNSHALFHDLNIAKDPSYEPHRNKYPVMRAVQRQSIESYWAATSTYEGLKDYITMNFEGLRDSVVSLLVGNSEPVDVLRLTNDMHSVNSKDAVLTLLIHLGYLSYNRAESSCCIPNQEVRLEFESTIQATDWSGLAEAVRNSAQLLRDTLAGNSEAVAKAIESVHQNNTSILQYNDENALSYVVSLAYQAGQLYYHFVRELPTGKGFAVAAFLEPEILVVDEVLAVGDAEFQKKAIGQGRTVLFVSHNMASEIQPLCKKRVLLENGMKSYRKAA